MRRSTKSSLFPEVNVWLALTYEAHVHHVAAASWLAGAGRDARLFFCRITQLSLLRLLTTEAIIGSKLIREGLERSKQAGYDAVVVLGDPNYYSRFGFVRAAAFGLHNEYGVHDEFMVLPLHDGALARVSGMVKYLPEF